MESFYQILNSFSKFWPKTEKYSKELRGVNIDQIEMCYKWIRLNELYKLMESCFQISESFFDSVTIIKIIVAFGLCKRGGGGICAEQHAF